MNENNEVQKIRWNIANAMTCVLETIKESKGKVKKTNQYIFSYIDYKKKNINIMSIHILLFK